MLLASILIWLHLFGCNLVLTMCCVILRRDELLNTVYSQSDFTLDEGERLLKGMQELREELNQYGEVVQSLAERAQDVVPLKQRRQPVTRPIPILAICNYKQNNVSIIAWIYCASFAATKTMCSCRFPSKKANNGCCTIIRAELNGACPMVPVDPTATFLASSSWYHHRIRRLWKRSIVWKDNSNVR